MADEKDKKPDAPEITDPPTPPIKDEEEEEKLPDVVIPEKVVKEIKDKTSDNIDEKIKEALRKGSDITKGQLYPEIKRQKEKIKQLNDAIEAKKAEEVSTTKTKEELTKIESEKAELSDKLKIVEDALVETTSKLEDLTIDYTSTKLESYKLNKIAKAKGKLVAGMVVGKTEAEIDAAIEVAKSEYERIENSMKKEFKIPEKKEETLEDKEALKPTTVTRIDPSRESTTDWSKKRSDILSKVYKEAREKLGING